MCDPLASRRVFDDVWNDEHWVAVPERGPHSRVNTDSSLCSGRCLMTGSPHVRAANECVHHWLEARAASAGEAIALTYGDTSVSFATLNRAANAWAGVLREHGIGPEVLVGIYGPRTIDTVVGMFAVLKAGGGYVPLDPRLPQNQIADMLQCAKVQFVVGTAETDERRRATGRPGFCLRAVLDQDVGDYEVNVDGGAAPENLATVIFTSGSEGRPKAVAIAHRAITDRLASRTAYRDSGTRCQKASFGVVAHIGDLLLPLAHGRTVVVVPDDALADAVEFAELLRRHRVATVMLIPSHLRALLTSPDATGRLGGLTRLLVSGEAVSPQLVQQVWTAMPGVAVLNVYGLSESTGAITVQVLDQTESVTAGKALGNTSIHLLDRDWQEVPRGCEGEICVAGPQLARGYLHRPSLTADRFVPNPFGEPGARLYRTGDIGRVTADGLLEVTGRLDHEVKIKGRRVHLSDVEHALELHPAVREAAVLFERTGPDDGRLRAFVTASAACSAPELRRHLQLALAPHMVPALYDVLPAGLPLLPGGKIDRQRLLASIADGASADSGSPSERSTEAERETSREREMAALWAQVLHLSHVDREDSFFELGGDSLAAMELVARVATEWAIDLQLGDLFAHPTVAALTLAIDGGAT